jgi:hypothetical protein
VGCWYAIVMMRRTIFVRTFGHFTAEGSFRFVVGILLSFLLPLIGVFVYYRKRTRPPIHRKVLLVSTFAMVFSFLAYRGSWVSPTSLNKERISILAREGAGLLPVSQDQSVWDSPVRSCFADISDFSRRYLEEANQLDRSALSGLYSAESFKDSRQMEKVLTQLRALLALEGKYASLDPILERNKARIRSVDAPDSAKNLVLDTMNGSAAQKGIANRSALYAKEKAWIQSSIDLYEFTLTKRDSYALRDGKLVFKNRTVMSEFNQRLKDAVGRKADILQANEDFENLQKEGLREFNLQPSDMRLSQEAPPASRPK